MAKIHAPNTDYSSTGAFGVKFERGVGETDDDRAIAYYERKGYGIDGPAPEREDDTPEVADPRHVTHQTAPSVKDAAVDADALDGPATEAFLPPTNVGENPHGPKVVSPGIHAAPGPKPVIPGPVSDDAGEQEQVETDVAERDVWADYARSQGATDDELDGLGRDEIRDRWGS